MMRWMKRIKKKVNNEPSKNNEKKEPLSEAPFSV
jgi:hypothetical protein